MNGGTRLLFLPLALSPLLPFAVFRANRIAEAEPRSLVAALGGGGAALAVAGLAAMIGALVLARRAQVRTVVAAALVVAILLAMGWAAARLTAGGPPQVRVGPGAGFWVALVSAGLLVVDARARLHPRPAMRLAIVAVAVAIGAAILWSGALSQLSIMQEYGNRSASFWREGARHLWLAFGSFASAMLAGVPLGIGLTRARRASAPVLGLLTMLQTIPSMALFGMLIAPLAWIAANVPAAHALGIRGIGAAPAFAALFLYSLLPIVANTVVGLTGVPRSVTEAADGMGLTRRQRLTSVDVPLALPVIVSAARIVLVQNIGMATVGALIGAGGFGTFVFQGIGQTATDLILLGALPTVALAFATSAVLDALIGMLPGTAR